MGSFIDCWGKHIGNSEHFSAGDKDAILAKIQEHVSAGETPADAAKLAVRGHLEAERANLAGVYDQSAKAVADKERSTLTAQAEKFDKRAQKEKDPDVQATLKEKADSFRAQANSVTEKPIKGAGPEASGKALGESNGQTPPVTEPAQQQGQGGAGATGETPTTGVANRVLTAEAQAGKIGEVSPGEGMSWQEMVDMGREQLNKGADPNKIAADFKKTGKLSPQDFSVLRAERERLAVESNKAADAANANPNDPAAQKALADARKTETDFIRNTIQPAKTATSDIFRGMQGEAPIDTSTFEGMRRAIVDRTGREPTPSEVKVVNKRINRIQKVKDMESKALDRMGKEIDNALPKTKTPTTEQLRTEMEKMVQELTPCKV